jgi:hypothetical protein
MTGEKDNNQIIQYLLGALPEEEAERFDELSFTDDEFAETLQAAENNLIDRYIQNELDEETRKSFESFYLTSPLRRKKVKFAESLQVFSEQNIEKTKEGEKNGFFPFIINLFGNYKMQFGFTVAALLLLILGSLWIFKNPSKDTEIGQQKTPLPIETPPKNENTASQDKMPSAVNSDLNNSPIPTIPENRNTAPTPKPTITVNPTSTPIEVKPIIASLVLTPPLRGGNKFQSLLITNNTTRVAARLQLETDDYKTYSVSLLDPSNKNILQSGRIKARGVGGKRYLSLSFPAKLLADGFYSLNVSGISDDGTTEIISSYSFRAVLK